MKSSAVGRFAGGSGNSRAAARLQQARTMDSGGAQAQLQNTNANLEQELTRQRAALDAHQRFAQRSLATSEADKTRATQAAGEAAQRNDELTRQLAEATRQRNAAEEELRSLRIASCAAETESETRTRLLRQQLTDERELHMRKMHAMERDVRELRDALREAKEATEAKGTPATTVGRSSVGSGRGSATCPPLSPSPSPSPSLSPTPSPTPSPASSTGEADAEQLQQLQAALREARESSALKDRQLAKLRRQLADAQELADEAAEGKDSCVAEELSDELRVMRESFEKRMEHAQQQAARASRQHEQRELELERALKESEEERTLLASQLQRKVEELRQQRVAQ